MKVRVNVYVGFGEGLKDYLESIGYSVYKHYIDPGGFGWDVLYVVISDGKSLKDLIRSIIVEYGIPSSELKVYVL